MAGMLQDMAHSIDGSSVSLAAGVGGRESGTAHQASHLCHANGSQHNDPGTDMFKRSLVMFREHGY